MYQLLVIFDLLSFDELFSTNLYLQHYKLLIKKY